MKQAVASRRLGYLVVSAPVLLACGLISIASLVASPATLREVGKLRLRPSVIAGESGGAVVSDSHEVVVTYRAPHLTVWRAGHEPLPIEMAEPSELDLTDDGRWVLADARLINTKGGDWQSLAPEVEGEVGTLQLVPDGKWVALLEEPGVLHRFDVATGAWRPAQRMDACEHLTFTSASELVCRYAGGYRVLEPERLETVCQAALHDVEPKTLHLVANNHIAIAADWTKSFVARSDSSPCPEIGRDHKVDGLNASSGLIASNAKGAFLAVAHRTTLSLMTWRYPRAVGRLKLANAIHAVNSQDGELLVAVEQAGSGELVSLRVSLPALEPLDATSRGYFLGDVEVLRFLGSSELFAAYQGGYWLLWDLGRGRPKGTWTIAKNMSSPELVTTTSDTWAIAWSTPPHSVRLLNLQRPHAPPSRVELLDLDGESPEDEAIVSAALAKLPVAVQQRIAYRRWAQKNRCTHLAFTDNGGHALCEPQGTDEPLVWRLPVADPERKTVLSRAPWRRPIVAATWLPGSSELVVVEPDGILRTRANPDVPTCLRKLGPCLTLAKENAAALTPTGEVVALGADCYPHNQRLVLVNSRDGRLQAVAELPRGLRANALTLTADGKRVALAVEATITIYQR